MRFQEEAGVLREDEAYQSMTQPKGNWDSIDCAWPRIVMSGISAINRWHSRKAIEIDLRPSPCPTPPRSTYQSMTQPKGNWDLDASSSIFARSRCLSIDDTAERQLRRDLVIGLHGLHDFRYQSMTQPKGNWDFVVTGLVVKPGDESCYQSMTQPKGNWDDHLPDQVTGREQSRYQSMTQPKGNGFLLKVLIGGRKLVERSVAVEKGAVGYLRISV